MKLNIFLIAASLVIFSCNNSQSTEADKKETVISTDIKKLEKIIDLSGFNPDNVQFVYGPVVKQNEPDLVPGPTDYRLEAVLYFKADTRVNRNGCAPFEQSQFSRDDFNFDWLPDNVRGELLKESAETKGYQASCFYKGVLLHGSYYYLRDKILLSLFTN